jgi:hypothetical protein
MRDTCPNSNEPDVLPAQTSTASSAQVGVIRSPMCRWCRLGRHGSPSARASPAWAIVVSTMAMAAALVRPATSHCSWLLLPLPTPWEAARSSTA